MIQKFKIGLSILSLFLVIVGCTNRSFNSELWKDWTYKGSESFLRWDMSNDLVNNYKLIGKSKKEIIELLGMPDNENRELSNDFYYDLGPCRRGIDFGSLNIRFKNERVISFEKHCS